MIPYNPILLMRYNCHINVEICCSIKFAKYLYKYIYIKGMIEHLSLLSLRIMGKKVINEIKQYRDSRMITAIEAVHRLYAFKLYSMSPPGLQMLVHLEGMYMLAYKSTANLNNVVRSEKSQRSMLTEYFKVNN